MAPARSSSTQYSALNLAKTTAATHTVHANEIEGQISVVNIVGIWKIRGYASTSSTAKVEERESATKAMAILSNMLDVDV